MRFNRKQSPACPKFCHEMFIGCDFQFFMSSFFALKPMPRQTLTSHLDFPPFQRQKQQ